jgi:anthranilate phosphoribosyltransferase
VRTIFNILGPLTNPASPHVQLIGVYDPIWLKPLAEVMVQLGMKDGLVVHGQGNDEIVLSGPTQIVKIENGELHQDELWPEDFGLKTQEDEHLEGGLPQENAILLRRILEGEKGPFREAVCMNSAALIQAAYRSSLGKRQSISLQEAYKIAETSIDRKVALGKLQALKDALSGTSQ